MRLSTCECNILLEAKIVLELEFHSRPAKSVTLPPASLTMSATALKSQGVELLSRNASQAPVRSVASRGEISAAADAGRDTCS